MSRTLTTRTILIDARPRGPHGPLAGAQVLGRPVIAHLVDAARHAAQGSYVVIHAHCDDHALIHASLEDDANNDTIAIVDTEISSEATVLLASRLYDNKKLKRLINSGRTPESAEVWRLDSERGVQGASDELIRVRAYQPLGRFWARRPARLLAQVLQTTKVRPNHLTILAGTAMFTAAALVATTTGSLGSRSLPALLMACALVIDTADGHLARLQGTASQVGRWLDATLDEMSDMALHAAIAWSAFVSSGHAGWLVLGMLYGMFKYMFVVSNTIWDDGKPRREGVTDYANVGLLSPWSLRGLTHWMGHADIRWHAWILLAAVGRLDIELIAASAYFPLRFLAGSCRKAGANHEQA